MQRRAALRALAAMVGWTTASAASPPPPVATDAWPTRAVHVLVPTAPGSPVDGLTRVLCTLLSRALKKPFVIDNIPGQMGATAALAASQATADGHTLLIANEQHAIAPALLAPLGYDLERDFLPIMALARAPIAILTQPDRVPASDLRQLIDWLRKTPARINYASAGPGSLEHLAGELFQMLTATQLVHVPYRNAAPAVQDLAGGMADLMFESLGLAGAHVRTGRMRALAIAAPQRHPFFPSVPTTAEAGLAGYEVHAWAAVLTPRGTPAETVRRIRDEIARVLPRRELAEVWAQHGLLAGVESVDTVAAWLRTETHRWGEIVRHAGVRLD